MFNEENMKVDNNYEYDVKYGFFDDFEVTDPLTEEQYNMLLERKLERIRIYHEQNQKLFDLL